MVLPLLAAIPSIIGAISDVSELFDSGKEIVEAVTGNPSTAKNAEDLHRDVTAMTPAQQEQWSKAMQNRVAMYEAQNNRIENEQGSIAADILETLPPEVRGKVALLRMTTRPLVVLRLLHVILLPVYVMFIDGLIMLHNIIQATYGSGKVLATLGGAFMGEGTIYLQLYQIAAPTAATVVVTYMAARAVEKVKGKADGSMTVSDAVSGVTGLIGKVRGWAQ